MRNDTKLDVLWEEVEELKKSGGGGSDLPEVTEADNGKLLGVVNGAWNKMDAPAGGVDYSTTEQNTGLKWIDGKAVYQRVISLTNLSITSTAVVIGSLQTGENLLFANGSFIEENITYVTPDPGMRIFANASNEICLKAEQGATWSITTGAIIIYYTKTPATKSKKKTTK